MRRFDSDSDGRIVYSDFCDAFTPRDGYHANILQMRPSVYIHRQASRHAYFMPTTRDALMKCFRVHFEIEESIELIKQRLSRRPKFNIEAAFGFLDSEERNYITLEGLRKVFADNKLYPGEDDLVRLLYRFDKTKNGRVTYQEFVDELTPKNTITL